MLVAEAEAIFFDPSLPARERSLPAIAKRLGIKHGTVKNWSYQYNWSERRKEFAIVARRHSEDRFTRLAEEGLTQVEIGLQVGRAIMKDLSAVDEDGNPLVALDDRVRHLKTVGNTLKLLVETLERATGEDERKKTRVARAKPSPIHNNFGPGSQTLIANGFESQWGAPAVTLEGDLPEEQCDDDCDTLRLEEKNE